MPVFDKIVKSPADPRFTGACGAYATAAVIGSSPHVVAAAATVVVAASIEMIAIGTIERVFSLKVLLRAFSKVKNLGEIRICHACSSGLKVVFLQARRSASGSALPPCLTR